MTAESIRPRSAFLAAVTTVFSVVLLRTAWVGDDAFFTFRTIDNFVNGHGLRWNVAERVQAYTHPLWLLLVTPFYWLSGEAYFTSIAISAVLTLLVVWLLIGQAQSLWTATVALSVLLLSAAFIDYSTSGLENPLSNLLIVLFFGRFVARRAGDFVMALLVALVMLNRVDLGLLVLPAWLVTLPSPRRPRAYLPILLGLLPLAAWELFSLIYYGVPFPNTAYAKLQHGVPRPELIQQGLIYVLDSVQRDPITFAVIACAGAWGLVASPARSRPIAIGMGLYIAYVVWVGGDFMAGRMLEAPLVAAVVILIAADVSRIVEPKWALLVPVLILGLTAPASVFRRLPLDTANGAITNGVMDERAFYFKVGGLVYYTRDVLFPGGNDAVNGQQTRDRGTRMIAFGNNGYLGYNAGPTVHIVDTQGLGDPLLARLPATRPWRPGHFNRVPPAGYGESLQSGTLQIADPALAAYYARLSILVRDPIWSRRRLSTIVGFNLGRYDYLLKAAAPTPAP